MPEPTDTELDELYDEPFDLVVDADGEPVAAVSLEDLAGP